MDLRRLLTVELADFLESGVSILVGTRDAAMRPSCVRAVGARLDRTRAVLTIVVPESTSQRIVADVRDNGLVAVTFSRPIDHRSVQAKGTCTDLRAGGELERAIAERYRVAFFEQLEAVGLPRRTSRRMAWWPAVGIDVAIEALFVQTPGPLAGRPLEPEA